MTPTISPSVGALPQAAPQPMSLQQVLAGGSNLGNDSISSSDYGLPSMQAPTGPIGAPAATAGAAGAPGAVLGGGGAQAAAAGAGAVGQEQLVAALQNVIASVNALIAALQAQGLTSVPGSGPAVAGGGGTGATGQCGMAGCSMDHSASAPAQDAAAGASEAQPPAASGRQASPAASGAAPASASGSGNVDPASVKDKTGQGGLTSASVRGLQEAHRFGLPLVSGKRSGNGASDHDHGNAIDVGTLAIGSPSSSGATPQMQQFREYMRQQGKAGNLGVKYIISDGKIASANGNWEWRPYTYPGKSAGELEALKSSNRGEYNRLQHFDHVHVSFG